MKCPDCQGEIQAGWKACPFCGNALPEKNACASCGAEMQAGWKACPACGAGAVSSGGLSNDGGVMKAEGDIVGGNKVVGDFRHAGGASVGGGININIPGLGGVATPSYVVCPECGVKNPENDTFRCRVCGQEDLCRDHLDRVNRSCEGCAEKDRRAREQAEQAEQAEREEAARRARMPQRDKGWENSLGMKFVPVAGTEVLFGIWAARVQDYAVFAKETRHELKKPSFEQGSDHPALNVSWEDAQAFCRWLTEKEQKAGMLGKGMSYRLPRDLEWSAAVGLPQERGNTPKARNEGIQDHYPWGSQWPPPKGAGNYGQALKVDEFEYTSPVGSFKANEHGLYDLGGNVWEWCEDFYDGKSGSLVLRGASWLNDYQYNLLSSCRINYTRGGRRYNNGFRCVLVGGGGSPA
jgi:hypothetical protein